MQAFGVQERYAILWATIIAGTLDTSNAVIAYGLLGNPPGPLFRFVASGPFGDGVLDGGWWAILLGAVVHYVMIAIMAAGYLLVLRRVEVIGKHPFVFGTLLGIVIYLVMYWVVLPIRWDGMTPVMNDWMFASIMFGEIACVGIPIALIATYFVRGGIKPK